MSIKQPILACAIGTYKGKIDDDVERSKVAARLPLLASDKLDGIRCLHHPELGLVTRTFESIPNDYMRETIERNVPENLDGELCTYHDEACTQIKEFNEIQGDVMRKSGTPFFKFVVFDDFTDPKLDLTKRLANASCACLGNKHARYLSHKLVYTIQEVEEAFAQALSAGFEGLMLGAPGGKYKEGRSTLNQLWLAKLKEFLDAEGKIIGFEERMKNTNAKTKSATGHSKRSSAKAGKVGMNTLGALVLSTKWGELRVGSGFDDRTRQNIWNNRSVILGDYVTFKYQPYGAKNKPRFPVFLHFRDPRDMS